MRHNPSRIGGEAPFEWLGNLLGISGAVLFWGAGICLVLLWLYVEYFERSKR